MLTQVKPPMFYTARIARQMMDDRRGSYVMPEIAAEPSARDGRESEAVFAGLSDGAIFVETYCPLVRWVSPAALSVEV